MRKTPANAAHASWLGYGYYEDHSPRVNLWIRRGIVRVAALRDDDEIIIGWACGETMVHTRALHYWYTKGPYRRQQVATGLLDRVLGELGHGEIVRSHVTPPSNESARTKAWPHVPFLAFGPRRIERDEAKKSRAAVERDGAGPGHGPETIC
jgi:hypothetical protein